MWKYLWLVTSCACAFMPSPAIVERTGLLATVEEDLELPDYGKTPVEIDKIRFKWRRRDLFGQSLVDETLAELKKDEEFQETTRRLETLGAAGMTKEERAQRRRALDDLGIPEFTEYLTSKDVEKPTRKLPEVFQLNVGLHCNQACAHCHVESSPLRTEAMSIEVATQCLELLKKSPSIHTLDITGGAPEMNEHFRFLVATARALRPDLVIIDRCNLTVLQEPGQEDLVAFLKEHRVRIVASLPCYSAENVDKQRGNGVFDRSIAALLLLNDSGYGTDPDLHLDLVYNPLGAFLPPPQEPLKQQYQKELKNSFGILFNDLFTMTNMPVKRFADFLHRRGELKAYMELLVRNFNPSTCQSLMCLNTVSVGWDGKLFDCDFNQQLGYGIGSDGIHQGGLTVFDLDNLEDLGSHAIRNDNHCFGCTAGMGSS